MGKLMLTPMWRVSSDVLLFYLYFLLLSRVKSDGVMDLGQRLD